MTLSQAICLAARIKLGWLVQIQSLHRLCYAERSITNRVRHRPVSVLVAEVSLCSLPVHLSTSEAADAANATSQLSNIF